MDATADVILTGEAAHADFGWSVAGAGDLNDDGYSDVIVGAPSAGGHRRSCAYIYYGGPTMDNVADVTLTGAADRYGRFGWSVAGAGDVNDDGYGDVIVGAPRGTGGAGDAYIYYGASAMDNTADITLREAAYRAFFGESVAGAGDVNGDNYDDVIVGAPGNDLVAGAGRAYVYYGGSTPFGSPAFILTEQVAGEMFGISVGLADFNGDGRADIIVGAPGYMLFYYRQMRSNTPAVRTSSSVARRKR